MTDAVRSAVEEAFYNAKANGYTFEGWSDSEIALDMMECDSEIEKFSYREVMEAVADCRKIPL